MFSQPEFQEQLAGALALDLDLPIELARALLDRCGGRPSLVCYVVRLARERSWDPRRLADAALRPAVQIALPGWIPMAALPPPAVAPTRRVVADLCKRFVELKNARLPSPVSSNDPVAMFTLFCFAGALARWMRVPESATVWS